MRIVPLIGKTPNPGVKRCPLGNLAYDQMCLRMIIRILFELKLHLH